MKITDNHLRALLRYFQAGDTALAVDGLYGKRTAAALDTYIKNNVAPPAPLPEVSYMEATYESALLDTGQSEVPLGSNGGPYVEGLRTEVNLPRLAGGEWCSVFLSAHLQRQGVLVASRSARGLVRSLRDLPGGREVGMDDVGPGFFGLALKRRGKASHHVQIFKVAGNKNDPKVRYVGGNEGHKVKSKKMYLEDFFADCLMVVTYD